MWAIFPNERVADAPFNKYIIKIETVWCQNLSAAHLAHGFSGRDGGASQFHAHCARSRRAIIPDNVKSGEAAFISRRLLSYYLYTAAPGARSPRYFEVDIKMRFIKFYLCLFLPGGRAKAGATRITHTTLLFLAFYFYGTPSWLMIIPA
jgi:hypothetical protein